MAIKVVQSQLATRGDFHQRLEREARAISVLNHPHICTLYDIGEQHGTAYLVMEYLEGQTLAAKMREGPLSLDLLRRGSVHRDLKPSNLVLSGD